MGSFTGQGMRRAAEEENGWESQVAVGLQDIPSLLQP